MPEAVAGLIRTALPLRLALHIQALPQARLGGSVERLFVRSSMPTMCEAPVHMDRMLIKARELASCSWAARFRKETIHPKSNA